MSEGMMIIDDSNILAELNSYIKQHYKPASLIGIGVAGCIIQPIKQDIFRKNNAGKGKSFGEVIDMMSDYIKEKRDYVNFALSLDKLREKKGLSSVELYKTALINKRLYSRIMTTANYRPAKNTVISFGLALKLKPEEFASFIRNTGFALSDSSKFDLVISFCFEHEIFDLHRVNDLLLKEDQKTLANEAA
jgi:hypothetical protein